MYAVCQDMRGATAEDYAKVKAELGGADETAAGLVAHVAGPVEGGFRIIDTWESHAAARAFWTDHLGAGVNAIRTRTLIERADVVVVRFGEQYRQWNAAFDAGYAAALGKPLITLHPSEHDHALKEVDRAALAVAREPEQVVEILRYALAGLPVA